MKAKTAASPLLIFSLLFLSLLLRLPALNQSLWLDEAIQAQAARLSLPQLLKNFLPGDFHPPLYYLFLHGWARLFGLGEVSLRLPSVIFGVLSVWLMFLIGLKLFPRVATSFHLPFSYWAALLLATAPLHLYYSQEARMYSLACFTTLLAVYSFLRFLKQPTLSLFLQHSFSAALMAYSHYLTWLMFPVFWLAAGRQRKKLFLSHLLTALFLLPWLPFFFKQLKTGLGQAAVLPVWAQTVGHLSLKNWALVPVKFLIGRIALKNPWLYTLSLIGPLALAGFLLLLSWKKRDRQTNFLWLWLLLPLLLGSLISLFIPVFRYFRFLFVLPAFYLLLLKGAFNLSAGWRRKSLVFLLVLNLFCSAVYLSFPRFHRENWKKAVAVLHRLNRQQAPVLVIAAVRSPFDYYDQGATPVFDYSQAPLLLAKPYLWLIKYGQPIFEPDNRTEKLLLKAGFQPIFEHHFRGGVTLKKFLKPENFQP